MSCGPGRNGAGLNDACSNSGAVPLKGRQSLQPVKSRPSQPAVKSRQSQG